MEVEESNHNSGMSSTSDVTGDTKDGESNKTSSNRESKGKSNDQVVHLVPMMFQFHPETINIFT